MKRSSLFEHDAVRCGFTWVEVLVVIAIMALLSGLILGLAGNAQKSAARTRAEAEIAELESFLTDCQMKYGRLSLERGELMDLLEKKNHSLASLADPWGPQYFYFRTSPVTYCLWSRGGQTDQTPKDDDPALCIGNVNLDLLP